MSLDNLFYLVKYERVYHEDQKFFISVKSKFGYRLWRNAYASPIMKLILEEWKLYRHDWLMVYIN